MCDTSVHKPEGEKEGTFGRDILKKKKRTNKQIGKLKKWESEERW